MIFIFNFCKKSNEENGKTNSVDFSGVLITLFGKNKRSVNSQITDQHGKILFLDVTKDGSKYVLVIIYNANKESEQLKVLNYLSKLMKKVKNNTRKTAWPGRLL